MKDSTTDYCSCYTGLFGCTTECEESKKLRGTRDILTAGGGDSHIKRAGMLVGKFQTNP